MYAIVKIAGVQYKVLPENIIYVHYLGREYKEGEELVFNSINLIDRIKIKVKIIAHIKDDKVFIFKKKRRKAYQLLRGHRQKISIIKIISFI